MNSSEKIDAILKICDQVTEKQKAVLARRKTREAENMKLYNEDLMEISKWQTDQLDALPKVKGVE